LLHPSLHRIALSCASIFAGNEGDVELYANHTGLMWENAPQFRALLVFAQHRLWAPNSVLTNQTVQYLSSSQALADYAVLLRAVQSEFATPGRRLPVIAFGGSYGGVLSAMMRSKYPGSVDGAIASSAPLRAFPGQLPPWDSSSYYAVITHDVSAAGGSAPACEGNLRKLWPALFAAAETPAGLATLTSEFQTCTPLADADDALALAFWIRGNFDSMSMGNYPYPSSYMTGGAVELPAYPVRVACGFLADPSLPSNPAALFAAARQASAVLANATADQPCFAIPPNPYTHPSEPVDGLWDWQHCTELQPDSFWFSANGVTDAFWPQPYNATFITEHCAAAWNVTPSYDWITTAYGLPEFTGALCL
jgi:lysosomal Pro-X carboxypeptidase